ncbi:YolD-like family protein [Lysinibacillus odysseyi]|uniref:YolD-like family protein n=1 Tax=Lysinibacillus odysseyi 34hs-1 = NBRC 100172 TaxID=1220589 RepID=A0A0A3ILZ7_9BACI|nr:YolD-like family protein [Lysinibacillus odysseyi]KGR85779.1 hypothetical protein CD32_07990 [Lysinibacillus odysseyi 34hs-1 = NBRC 100172]
MNRDRGTIKWNAMMLPEHVNLLHEWKAEDNKIEKPNLDEWACQELGAQLTAAYHHRLPIRLTVWQEGEKTVWTTVIKRVDDKRQSVYTEEGKEIAIRHLYNAIIMD